MTTKELIQALGLDFDRHLRIGVTADGDYFVQVIRLNMVVGPKEAGEIGAEDILAECEGGLDTCLRNVLNTLQHAEESQ